MQKVLKNQPLTFNSISYFPFQRNRMQSRNYFLYLCPLNLSTIKGLPVNPTYVFLDFWSRRETGSTVNRWYCSNSKFNLVKGSSRAKSLYYTWFSVFDKSVVYCLSAGSNVNGSMNTRTTSRRSGEPCASLNAPPVLLRRLKPQLVQCIYHTITYLIWSTSLIKGALHFVSNPIIIHATNRGKKHIFFVEVTTGKASGKQGKWTLDMRGGSMTYDQITDETFPNLE